jgi:hypothetical protein
MGTMVRINGSIAIRNQGSQIKKEQYMQGAKRKKI